MGPVGKSDFIVIGFHIFYFVAFVPRKGEVVYAIYFLFVEIILNMTLGTNQGTHFLVTDLGDVLSLALKSFDQGGTGNVQIHGFGIVAVGTANVVHHFVAPHFPCAGIKFGYAMLGHQSWYIGTFTGPAGVGLIGFGIPHGRTNSQGLLDVLNGIIVPSGLVVIPGKSIAGPQYYHTGVFT